MKEYNDLNNELSILKEFQNLKNGTEMSYESYKNDELIEIITFFEFLQETVKREN